MTDLARRIDRQSTATHASRGGAGLQRVAAVVLLLALPSPAPAQTPSSAATRLIDATPAPARAALLQPFTLEARSDRHYTPRRRAGVAWRDMSAAQRAATTDLLPSALSETG